MTLESLGPARRRTPGQTCAPDGVRQRLVDGMGRWKAQLAYHTAMLELLDAHPGEDPTSVDRALTALHMYRAGDPGVRARPGPPRERPSRPGRVVR
jgi:hypothetical protein